MAYSVAGNCRESTAGTQVYRSVSMVTAVRLIIAAGPQTGTCRATWSASRLWSLVRTAAVFLYQNCLVATQPPPIAAFGMPDQENREIVMSLGSLGMLTLIWVWAKAFR